MLLRLEQFLTPFPLSRELSPGQKNNNVKKKRAIKPPTVVGIKAN